MTPKEKAKELVDRYERYSNPYYYGPLVNFGPHFSEEEKRKGAKRCAEIAVGEILYALSVPPIQNKGHLLYDAEIDYWQLVKQEIEAL